MKGCADVRRVEVRGLGYSVSVTGRPAAARGTVLFLHGFAGSAADWNGVAAPVAAQGLASFAVDLPGHGRTDLPADTARFSIEETVRDLVQLLDALGTPRVHAAGYSMGGRVALHLALEAPNRVASLLLESASAGIETSAERAERAAADESLAAEIESRGVPWFVDHWERHPLFHTQRALPSSVLEPIRARRLLAAPQGLAGSLRGLGQGVQPYLGHRLAALSCPTLFVTGGLDTKYTSLSERMAAQVPDAERLVVPAAGHNVHLEQPRAFRRAILDHLHRVERTARAEVRVAP
jgi:2-succinyl-6-hydroxy-2,4-cyclohexadiene-1-carboxylate synthase